ncbi:MAG: OmpA family protein [Rhodospirillales bacterium]|nr:OmpA family protein [Rhodospirillales bacterium]
MKIRLVLALAVLLAVGAMRPVQATDCSAPSAKHGIDFSLPCSYRNPIPVAEQTVFFASHSAELSPETRATLDRQAAILARHPTIRIEIVAFADDVEAPKPAEKLALGAKRDQAIGAYLIAKGIPASAITARGRETNVLIPKKLDAPTLAQMRQAFADAK